jgi:tetratricopeptide (TPR) repeat protein
LIEQVAELHRRAGMLDEALALYRQAVAAAPDASTPRIHLGEYLHSLGRVEEARATWRAIAAGPNRTARNLRTLADILADFDDRAEAVTLLEEARQLDPTDIGLALQQADLLVRLSRYPEALKTLDAAANLAANPAQAEDVLTRRIDVELAAGTLAAHADALAADLASGRESSSQAWYRLARYREATRQWPAAEAAARRALTAPGGQDPVNLWAALARISEGAGRLGDAAQALRRLADLDPRGKPEHLRRLATIEARFGHREPALAASRELLTVARNDPTAYRFHAQICLKLDARDEAIDVLRIAVRVNPGDPTSLAALADALVEAGRTEESIELNWRAFTGTDDPLARRKLAGVLARLYLKLNQFDRLVERLERQRRDADRDPEARRTLTLCLANAYQSIGEIGTARGELERLAAERPGDVPLLQQLVALAEREGDLAAALQFQRQLAKISPRDSQDHLIALLLQVGDVDEAMRLWEHEAGSAQEMNRLLELTDNLLLFGQAERALPTILRVLRDQPRDWEALYREGLALATLKRYDEAAQRFQAILDLRLRDDELSRLIGPRGGFDGGTAEASPLDARSQDDERAFFDRLAAIEPIQEATGLSPPSARRKQLWTPADFGQARMAAVAWLDTLSRKTRKNAAFLATLRDRRGDAKVAPRGWWDWFLLHVVKGDRPACREAATALLATGEPEAQWAYLTYFADRETARPSSPPRPSTPAELDQALLSFRTLRGRRPDWIDAPRVAPLVTALKTAGRTADADAVIRESVAVAVTVPQIVSLLEVVGERGDVDGVLRLFAGLDGRSWALSGQRQYPASELAQVFMKVIDARAEAGAFADVSRVLEAFLDANRRRMRAAMAMTKGITAPPADPIGPTQFYVGTYRRTLDMEFPAPGSYLDWAALQTLGDAFMVYEKADQLDDLFALVKARAERAAGSDRSFEHLLLCGMHWWNGEKSDALAELTRAVEASPTDPALRLELARMHESLGQPTEALAVIDALPATDLASVHFRESAALRVAVRSGNLARVSLAADRLFPLRLDAAAAAEIAGQMRLIGMHDRATIIVDRARNQTAGNPVAMRSLMGQYQTQNRVEDAITVANQILRLTRVHFTPPSSSLSGSTEVDEFQVARTQALTFLATTDRIHDMIARAEERAKARPSSFAMLEALAELYTATADKPKLNEILERMAQLRPDDARFHYGVALAFSVAGADAKAIEQFNAAIRADISLYFSNGSFEVAPVYHRAGRMADLLALIEHDDSELIDVYETGQVLTTTFRDPKLVQPSLRVLRTTMAKPSYVPGSLASYLIGQFGKPFTDLPESEAILRSEMIPPPGRPLVDRWLGMHASTPGLLQFLESRGQLTSFRDEVARVLKERPEWVGGQAIRALIAIRQGRTDLARELLTLLVKADDDPPATATRVALVEQIAAVPELLDLAIELAEAEKADSSATSEMPTRVTFGETTAASSLVDLYRKTGRVEQAKALAMKSFRSRLPKTNDPSNFNFSSYLPQVPELAEQFLAMDDPVDALRVILMSRERARERDRERLEGPLEHVLAAVGHARAETVLRGLMPDQPGDGEPAIDLMILVHPAKLEASAVVGVLDNALRSAAAEPGTLAAFLDRLAKVRQRDPKNLGLAIAEFLAVSSGPGSADAVAGARERLIRLVEDRPLEPVPPGKRISARQRKAAVEQVPLWLAARVCLRKDADHAFGVQLGERALLASRRQDDPALPLAILREWGQIERDRGDRAAARARWSEMILALDDRAGLPAVDPAAGAKGGAPLLPEHCHKILEVAALAARGGEVELSLSATLSALRYGPPAAAAARVDFTYARGEEDEIVVRQLIELEALWREANADPERVYATLRGIVLPEARPDEVFPYQVSLDAFESDDGVEPFRPNGAGRLLAAWAARAGRSDDLIRGLQARAPRPLAELTARTVLAQVAAVLGRDALLLEQVAWLEQRLDKDAGILASSQGVQVGLIGLDVPAASARSLALLERALDVTSRTNAEMTWPLPIRREVARTRLRDPDPALGPKSVEAYLQAIAEPRPASTRVRRSARTLRNIATRETLAAAQWAVSSCVEAGRFEPAWDFLGRLVDLETAASPSTIPAERRWLYQNLAARPAAERYALLKAWVVPHEPRKRLRLTTFARPNGTLPTRLDRAVVGPGGYLDSFSLLVAAAAEAGKLAELATFVEPLVAEGRPEAESLGLLVAIAQGPAPAVAPRIQDLVARRTREIKKEAPQDGTFNFAPPQPDNDRSSEALIALACLERDELRKPGRELTDLLLSAPNGFPIADVLRSRLQKSSVETRAAAEAGVARLDSLPRLPYWHVASGTTSRSGPPDWVASEGHIGLVPGAPPSSLRLAVPLRGAFEFRCEASSAGMIGFGGRTFAQVDGPAMNLFTMSNFPGRNLFNGLPGTEEPAAGPVVFHAYRLVVDAERIQCWVDGRLVYESTDLGRSFPWLTLEPDLRESGPVVFRNLQLTGKPEPLAEIPLSEGDHPRWATELAEPLGAADAQNPFEPAYDASMAYYRPSMPSASAPMSFGDGSVLGHLQPDSLGRPGWFLLSLDRPLLEGDSVSYEFRYEPGSVMVHPTLGQRVFRIEPGGVEPFTLRDDDRGRIPEASAPPKPARGPVPLRPGNWNTLRLTIVGGEARFELNGENVFTEPVPADQGQRFSLAYPRHLTAARARNVKLILASTSTSIDLAREIDLTATEPPASPEQLRGARALLGERILKQNARAVVERSRGLAPLERYQALRDWMLPSDAHVAPRVVGEFSPVASSSPAAATPLPFASIPALDLVEVAALLGKLDELAIGVRKSAEILGQVTPEHDALDVAISLARGDDATATTALSKLRDRLEHPPVPPPAPARRPEWPEYVAALVASRKASTRPEAAKLLAAAVARLDTPGAGSSLELPIRRALEDARAPISPSDQPPPRFAYWVASSHQASQPRHPALAASWTWNDGELRRVPGEGNETLRFVSPLGGDFDFQAEVSLEPARAVRVAYAGLSLGLAADGKTFQAIPSTGAAWSGTIDPPLDPARPWHLYQLGVRNGRMTTRVDDHVIHEAPVPTSVAPWLAFESLAASRATVKNPRLSGEPRIPASLELATGPTLADWIVDDRAFARNPGESSWEKVGGEILGRTSRSKRGRDEESLLRYVRPLNPHDSIEYDFLYVPGRSLISPALDAVAFLLEPPGVRARPLGHGGTSFATAPADEVPPRPAAPLPLREGSWNQVVVARDGSSLILRLNGVEVDRRPLADSDRPRFGFFHESDRTVAKIRAVRLVGSWPVKLPPADQLMAVESR